MNPHTISALSYTLHMASRGLAVAIVVLILAHCVSWWVDRKRWVKL